MNDKNSSEMQLRLKVGRLVASYREGNLSLKVLIDDLDDVWNALAPSSWRDKFRAYWWNLEQVYAVALDRNQLHSLPVNMVSDIDDAIEDIEDILK